MATEKQISINYSQAKSWASELEEEAKRLKRLADSEFSSSIVELRTAWKGENAELYIQKCMQLKEEMLGTARNLTSVASGIRSKAKAIYDAEMENLRIMQKKAAMAATAEPIKTVETTNHLQEKKEDTSDIFAAIAKGIFGIFK